jgi:hypothetical protein
MIVSPTITARFGVQARVHWFPAAGGEVYIETTDETGDWVGGQGVAYANEPDAMGLALDDAGILTATVVLGSAITTLTSPDYGATLA